VVISHSEVKRWTWSGANEALNKKYTLLWVILKSEGNKKLAELGANVLPIDIFENTIDFLCNGNIGIKKTNSTLSLFDELDEKKGSSEKIKANIKKMNIVIVKQYHFLIFSSLNYIKNILKRLFLNQKNWKKDLASSYHRLMIG